jgi:hypothetical protein
VPIERQAREAWHHNFYLAELNRHDPQAHANIMHHMNAYLNVESNRERGVTAKQIAVMGRGDLIKRSQVGRTFSRRICSSAMRNDPARAVGLGVCYQNLRLEPQDGGATVRPAGASVIETL